MNIAIKVKYICKDCHGEFHLKYACRDEPSPVDVFKTLWNDMLTGFKEWGETGALLKTLVEAANCKEELYEKLPQEQQFRIVVNTKINHLKFQGQGREYIGREYIGRDLDEFIRKIKVNS